MIATAVFYTPVKVPIVVRIWARISTSYIRSDVILKSAKPFWLNYGEGAIATPLIAAACSTSDCWLLKASADALGAGGRTDLNVQLDGERVGRISPGCGDCLRLHR